MDKTVDLFMFMGQSNMAGRGTVTEKYPEKAPSLIKDAGYEFRAVSAPNQLYPISEPFGHNENRNNGIDDKNLKTGSMVTAFTNAYYKNTGIPIIGISASKGGGTISQWQPNGAFLNDAISRLETAILFLNTNHYKIRHKFMLWCQGESDGDHSTPTAIYKEKFNQMLNEMLHAGIEKCFLIRIGHYNGTGTQDYSEIREAQDTIAQTNKNVIMVSTAFLQMKERGLMKDSFHYYQQAYNEVGTEAGINTALYTVNL